MGSPRTGPLQGSLERQRRRRELSEGRPSQLLSVGALGASLCADTENPVEGSLSSKAQSCPATS